MAITAALYGLLFTSLWNKEVNYTGDTINVMLTTSLYVPDQDTHQYKSSVTNEVTGTGYTAGGKALASKTVTYTTATNKHVLDAADVQWAASTITARLAVVYDATPATDATRPLIGYQKSSVDIVSSGGNFDLTWNAAGIVEISVGVEA